jgi:hypothetical protein
MLSLPSPLCVFVWRLIVCLLPWFRASPLLPFPSVQIKEGQVAEAVEFGRTHVVPLAAAAPSSGSGTSSSSSSGAAAAAAADRELLEDATALLAYDDPTTGPTGGRACLLLGAGWLVGWLGGWVGGWVGG